MRVSLAGLLCLGLLLTGCPRRFEDIVPPEETPAFLGPLSGVYLAKKGDVSVEGSRFLVAEFGKSLAFVLLPEEREDGGQTSLTFRGDIERKENGHVDVNGSFQIGEQGMLITTTASFSFGLGEATLSFPSIPQLACQNDVCVFQVVKLCDFDSTLAGSFTMRVEKLEESGDCSAVTPFEGGRKRWALASASGLKSVALVGLGEDGKVDISTLLDFDRQTQTLSLSSVLPIEASYQWTSDSSATFALATGDLISLSTDSLIRKTSTGCTQRFSAIGNRLSGTAPGISCPPDTGRVSCPLNASSCPDMSAFDGAFANARLVFQSSADARDPLYPACPATRCEGRAQAGSLCDDASRLLASTGCVADDGRVAKVKMEQKTDMFGRACVELSCGEACTSGDTQDRGNHQVLPCSRDAQVSFEGAECTRVKCAGAGDCPAPLACDDISWTGKETSSNGCVARVCSARLSNFPVELQTSLAALQTRYKITGLARQGQGPALPVFESSSEQDACDALALSALQTRCPQGGASLPVNHVCASAGVSPDLTLELYLTNNSQTCLRPSVSRPGVSLQLPPTSGCFGTEAACCVQASDFEVRYECRPSSPGYTVSFNIANTLGYPIRVRLDGDVSNRTDIEIGANGGLAALPFEPASTSSNYHVNVAALTPGVACRFTSFNATSATVGLPLTQPIDVSCAP
jgi:hypothetical protein